MNTQELISILVCPKCRGSLREAEGGAQGFACENCRVVYPVIDDIPVMLIDQAIPMAEWPEKAPKCVY